jgi:hypothetical protein
LASKSKELFSFFLIKSSAVVTAPCTVADASLAVLLASLILLIVFLAASNQPHKTPILGGVISPP